MSTETRPNDKMPKLLTRLFCSHSELRAQLVQYMDHMGEDKLQYFCQYLQGGPPAWNRYKDIIRTESSLVSSEALI